jgi:pantoate--beta-alanine ligase
LAVAERIEEVRQRVAAARQKGARIGLVPTMGALHAGHVSLIQAARRDCDFVAVSIFVNPTQFGPQEDLRKYPRPRAADLQACEAEHVDLVFHPEPSTVYPDGFRTFVEVEGLSNLFEGAFRPGHFRGVATVVLKLFNIVAPDLAYFGQKDFQQQLIIRRMCRDLDVPVEVRVCPTIREADGLALSSRNIFLSPDERRSALSLSRCLRRGEELLREGETDLEKVRQEMRRILQETPFVTTDYATLVDPETLVEATERQPSLVALAAARVGRTRLIDNLPIEL